MVGYGGPLRSREHPEGVDIEHPVVAYSNAVWGRTLQLFRRCCEKGGGVTIEHPTTAYSWRMANTKHILQFKNVKLHRTDFCMFPETGMTRTKKPTKFMSTMPWISDVCVRCDGGHVHAPDLCGTAAKKLPSTRPFSAQL